MNEMTTAQLKALMDSGADYTLLDCRGPDYFNWGHLPSAINLRWKYVADKAEKLLPDKGKLIITSCDGFTCGASTRCHHNLEKLGYTNLAEYSGGIADWLAHGHSLVDNPEFHIAPNAYRFPSQIFYGESVGSYLIEEDSCIVLIDGPMQLTEEHEDFILNFGKPMKVFMTHGSTAGDAKILQQKYKAQIYLHKADEHNRWLTVQPDVLFGGDIDLTENLHIIYTPGHTAGSCVLYDSHNRIMFVGDQFDEDLSQPIQSTERLLAYDFDKAYPFHYTPITQNAKQIITNYVNNI